MTTNKKEDSNKVVGGLFWTFAERISAQLVSTIVTIILARILDPDHYGVISLITIFITFCNVFVTSGFGSSVVRKKDVTNEDFYTAFSISFIMSIILYAVLFFISPLVANFYERPILCPIMRVMSIRIILASFNSIQQAHIQKYMRFKLFFIATLLGTIISAIIGIVMALKGFGAWSLVFQYLTNVIIDSFVLAIADKWIPKLKFNKNEAKYIFSFGWKVLVTDLIFTIEGDLRSLIIGKSFGTSDLAFYDQGKKYPALFVNNVNTSLNKVMLPTFSKKQDNILALKETLRKSISMGLFLLGPILIGFALISKDFVMIILTEKWAPAIPYIRVFCIMYLTRPLEVSCHQALLAIGKSGVVLIAMSIVSGFGLLTTIYAVYILKNVFYVAIGLLITQVLSYCCFMGAGWKYIGYSFKEQFIDMWKVIVAVLLMSLSVYVINFAMPYSKLLVMIIKILVGMIVYISSSIILKNKSLQTLLDKLKKFRKAN